MFNTIGKCGNCGGNVVRSNIVTRPYCEKCGANMKKDCLLLPILAMETESMQQIDEIKIFGENFVKSEAKIIDNYLEFAKEYKKEVEEVLKIGKELNEISRKKAEERK